MALNTGYNIQNSREGTYYPLLPSLVLLYEVPVYKSFDSPDGEVITYGTT